MRNTILTITATILTVLTATAQTTVGTVGQNYTIIGATTNINTSNVNINTAGGTVGIKANTTTIQGGNLNVTGNATNISTSYTNISGYNTTINSTYTTLGSAQTFITGTKVELGSSAVGAVTNIKSQANFLNGATMNGTKLTGIRADYSDGNSAVNVNQLFAVRDNLRAEANANKTQLTADIATAKTEAIESANIYTDGKFNDLSESLISEASRLDSRIDATNTNVTNLTNTVANNKAEAKNYTDTKFVEAKNYTNTEVSKAKAEAKAYTDAETTRAMLAEQKLKDDISFYNDRAMKAEAQLRTDLRTETERALKAEQDLSYEISGVGATVMALGALQSSTLYNPEKKGNMSFGVGTYKKSVAYAVGMSYYTTPNTKVSLNIAGGNNTKMGGGVGVSFGF
jgi:hypothetical protein